MKTTKISIIIATIGMFTLSSGLRLQAEQPKMNEALEQLEKARKSDHPVEHLERAKHDLELAEHNKHGERVEAIHQVNEAISFARKGEMKHMEAHIDLAIREVREGKHEAGRR